MTGPGQPATRLELIQALTELPNLDPIEQARILPALGDAAESIIADERARAMLAATDPGNPDRITQAELAARLNVHPNKVTKAIQRLRQRTRPH
jgi:hypothetical protein